MRLPPGPRRRFPGEFFLAIQREPLEFLTRLQRDHGDVVYFTLAGQPVVLLSHPDLVRDVLVTQQRSFHKGRGLERAKLLLGEGLLTSEGEHHLRQRRLAQPAFHRQRIAGYGAVMARYAARARDRWSEGTTLDVADEMTRLTLAIVGKTLFDADVEEEAPEIGRALTQALQSFNYAMLPFGELLDRLPLPPVLRFKRARARLDATIYRLIAERRASGEDHGDLLSMLLLARDGEDGGERDGRESDGEPGAGGRAAHGMSDVQLRDEAMTIFLAGHETTANLLTWSWYLLARNPDAEARLHAELDAVLGAGDRVPTADDLACLPYTRMVLAESMRLYPPAWILGRRAVEPVRIAGYAFPARTLVFMSQYVVHRDPRWYDEPERFLPERWLPDAAAARPRFSYFPFGAGTRVCIGEQFAWMEGALALATIARRWRLRLAPGHPVTPQPIITLRPKHGMRMVVGARR
jgi:cytochrome P450